MGTIPGRTVGSKATGSSDPLQEPGPYDSLRLDLLIQDLVIVECKATSRYNEVFEAQALTYLRLMNLKLGLVINFGERFVKDGFHRVVNGL